MNAITASTRIYPDWESKGSYSSFALHPFQGWVKMGMSNGRGQSIGFVLLKILSFVEENLNHVNHLILGSPSYPHHCLFHLKRRIFMDGQAGFRHFQKDHSPNMTENQCRSGVMSKKNLFDGGAVRTVFLNKCSKLIGDLYQFICKFPFVWQTYATAVQITCRISVMLYQSITGNPTARINAENFQGASGHFSQNFIRDVKI